MVLTSYTVTHTNKYLINFHFKMAKNPTKPKTTTANDKPEVVEAKPAVEAAKPKQNTPPASKKSLTEIGKRLGTDKATYHGFTDVYEPIFSKLTNPRILEIGVADFHSIAMYKEYFDKPYIVGMDVQDKSKYVDDTWRFVQGNQTDVKALDKCVEGEQPFDIIIDDGGHRMDEQQITFGRLFKHVKPGGHFIIEDLHTSFRPDYQSDPTDLTTYDMLKMMQKKELGYSTRIQPGDQLAILEQIESITIWAKDPDQMVDSVTAIIKKKR